MRSRAPRLTGKQIERAILRAGWYLHHSRGAHFYYRHLDHLGRQITIPIHAGDIVPQKTLSSILEQADLTLDEFMRFL